MVCLIEMLPGILLADQQIAIKKGIWGHLNIHELKKWVRIAIYEERDHNFVCFERPILWSSYPALAISWYEAWKQFYPRVPVSNSQHQPPCVVQEQNKGPVWLKAQP